MADDYTETPTAKDEAMTQELNADRRLGPDGGDEGPQEQKATPYVVTEQDGRVTRKWAMTIDLDRCTGCHACETACYAENNIPVVGDHQVHEGRIHTWIRVERYWEGTYPNVKARFMPIPCQHCDNAPCEPVCPVYATYHNPEGLNAMAYNRCLGTRYCGNNCPYSVRRFNWFEHAFDEPLNQQLNPDVTVRDLEPDEFTTACAQACPPKAITFGNVKDDRWTVAKQWNDPRRWRLLEELGASPAVVYLKTVDQEEQA